MISLSAYKTPLIVGIGAHCLTKIIPNISDRIDSNSIVTLRFQKYLGVERWYHLKTNVFPNAGITAFVVALIKEHSPRSKEKIGLQALQCVLIFIGIASGFQILKMEAERIKPFVIHHIFNRKDN